MLGKSHASCRRRRRRRVPAVSAGGHLALRMVPDLKRGCVEGWVELQRPVNVVRAKAGFSLGTPAVLRAVCGVARDEQNVETGGQ